MDKLSGLEYINQTIMTQNKCNVLLRNFINEQPINTDVFDLVAKLFAKIYHQEIDLYHNPKAGRPIELVITPTVQDGVITDFRHMIILGNSPNSIDDNTNQSYLNSYSVFTAYQLDAYKSHGWATTRTGNNVRLVDVRHTAESGYNHWRQTRNYGTPQFNELWPDEDLLITDYTVNEFFEAARRRYIELEAPRPYTALLPVIIRDSLTNPSYFFYMQQKTREGLAMQIRDKGLDRSLNNMTTGKRGLVIAHMLMSLIEENNLFLRISPNSQRQIIDDFAELLKLPKQLNI